MLPDRKTILDLDEAPGGVSPGDSLVVARSEGGLAVPYRIEVGDLQPDVFSGLSFSGVRLYREPGENLGAVTLLGGHWRLVGAFQMFSAILSLPTISGPLNGLPGSSQRPFFIAPLPTYLTPTMSQYPALMAGCLIDTDTDETITTHDMVQVKGELLDLNGSGLEEMTTLRLGVTTLPGDNLVLRVAGTYHVGI